MGENKPWSLSEVRALLTSSPNNKDVRREHLYLQEPLTKCGDKIVTDGRSAHILAIFGTTECRLFVHRVLVKSSSAKPVRGYVLTRVEPTERVCEAPEVKPTSSMPSKAEHRGSDLSKGRKSRSPEVKPRSFELSTPTSPSPNIALAPSGNVVDAVTSGDKDAVEAFLTGGADANQLVEAEDCKTLLHLACELGHTAVVKLLMLHGADQGASTLTKNETPLHLAIAFHRYETVAAILCHDKFLEAVLEIGDAEMNTPLHVACDVASAETIELLISRYGSESLETPNCSGSTPLCVAVDRQCDEHANARTLSVPIWKLLMKGAHAGPGVVRALLRNELPLAELLMEVASRREETYRMTLLHVACAFGALDAATKLVERGDDVNAKNHLEFTPLHLAAHFGQLPVVKMLLQTSSVARDAKSCAGMTPLDVARHNVEVTGFLCSHLAQGVIPFLTHDAGWFVPIADETSTKPFPDIVAFLGGVDE